MNHEAISWLEGLSVDIRWEIFTPVVGNEGLMTVKDDHETFGHGCRFCTVARAHNSLVVIE